MIKYNGLIYDACLIFLAIYVLCKMILMVWKSGPNSIPQEK